MIEFVLLFWTLCIASVGLGKLYAYLIMPGQLMSFMQQVIAEMKHHSEFIYKSIGGCDVCTRQRFTDLTYVLLIAIAPPTLPGLNIVLNFLLYLALYCLYGGLAFYFEAFVTKSPAPIPERKTTKIEL